MKTNHTPGPWEMDINRLHPAEKITKGGGKMKYRLTDETITTLDGAVLHRIERISNGERGGFIESEGNLDQSGAAWVSGDAWVSGEVARLDEGERGVLGINAV